MTWKLKQQRIIYRVKVNAWYLLYLKTYKSENAVLQLNWLYGLGRLVISIWHDASGYLLDDVIDERIYALTVFEEAHAFEAEHLDDWIAR